MNKIGPLKRYIFAFDWADNGGDMCVRCGPDEVSVEASIFSCSGSRKQCDETFHNGEADHVDYWLASVVLENLKRRDGVIVNKKMLWGSDARDAVKRLTKIEATEDLSPEWKRQLQEEREER